MGVAHLFYFTNFFRCLFKKRRNEHFENFPLWEICLIKLVKWTTHFNCWSELRLDLTFDSKVRFSQTFFFKLVYFSRGNWRCLKGVWRVSGRSLKSVWKSQCFKIGKLLGRNLWGGLVVLCIKLDKVFFTVFHVAWMLQCIYFVRCWCGMSLLGMVPE